MYRPPDVAVHQSPVQHGTGEGRQFCGTVLGHPVRCVGREHVTDFNTVSEVEDAALSEELVVLPTRAEFRSDEVVSGAERCPILGVTRLP